MRALLLSLLLFGARPSSAVVFQCPIPEGRRLPEILLIGENHCSPDSARVMQAFGRAAADGRLILGLENVYPGGEGVLFRQGGAIPRRPDHRIYGIDDGLLHGLSGAYLFGLMERGCRGDDSHTIANAASLLQRNRRMRNAWARLLHDEPGLAATPEAALLDRGARGETVEPAEVGRLDRARMDRFGLILRKLYIKFAQEAAEIAPQWQVHPLPEDLRDEEAVERARGSFEGIVLDARNRVMVNELMKLYCVAASEGKPIVAIVGYLHVRGMQDMLERQSGGQVTVVPYRSETQADGLIRMLNDYLARFPR